MPLINQTCARFLPMQVRELIYREILEYHPQVPPFPLANNGQQPLLVHAVDAAL